MSTHNLCFEQKYEKYQNILSENFRLLVIKFSVYLNRPVFVMIHPVWQGFSFIPLWIARRLQKVHAISVDSDQTARMGRLI